MPDAAATPSTVAEPAAADSAPRPALAVVAALATSAHPATSETVSPTIAIDWPAPLPMLGRQDLAPAGVALAGHVILYLALLNPAGRIGGEGRDFEAIGIDIVVAAPALETRHPDGARATAADVVVAPMDSRAGATPEEAAAPDSSQSTEPTRVPPASSDVADTPVDRLDPARRADIVVPEWIDKPVPADATPANDPVIARASGSGDSGERDQTTTPATASIRPSISDPLFSPAASTPAAALLASQEGGAAARGRDTIDVAATAALAAARVGIKDQYGSAVHAALRASPPQLAVGTPAASGKTTIEFKLGATGALLSAYVSVSSRRKAFDDAALAAVRRAQFPAPPPEIGEADRVYSMEYTFK